MTSGTGFIIASRMVDSSPVPALRLGPMKRCQNDSFGSLGSRPLVPHAVLGLAPPASIILTI